MEGEEDTFTRIRTKSFNRMSQYFQSKPNPTSTSLASPSPSSSLSPSSPSSSPSPSSPSPSSPSPSSLSNHTQTQDQPPPPPPKDYPAGEGGGYERPKPKQIQQKALHRSNTMPVKRSPSSLRASSSPRPDSPSSGSVSLRSGDATGGSLFDLSQAGSDSPPAVASPSASRKYTAPAVKNELRVGPEDFEVVKLIGKGDVGKVYLVRDKRTSHYHAMKVLNKSETIRRDKVQRAFTEQEILLGCNHPFLMTLHHCFQSRDHLYFVMEYCAGGEFFRCLQYQPHHRMDEKAAKFYIAEVILALEYIHLMGFIYRDLKPENILLHASGHIMLTDFDLSKRAADSAPLKVVTTRNVWQDEEVAGINTQATVGQIRATSFVGTEEYIAPEMIKGEGHSASVDWWTVGILLYEMLYATTPFKGMTRRRTFANIMEEPVAFPNRSPALSNACKNFIRRLLSKDQSKRLGSQNGAIDVRRDPWFLDIRWALLRNQTPPIVPQIANAWDTTNFRKVSEDSRSQNFASGQCMTKDSISKSDPFYGFESVSMHGQAIT
eukprot:Lithocolla_globosa_v1_NODE_3211_length_1732_cov_13.491950.p1 type:complete len:548 gc:universal NODE_3211_length_1732_cov_13.491950:31-1674(+)